jgi:hypothetical protein
LLFEVFEMGLDRDKPVFFVPVHGVTIQSVEVVQLLRATF